MRTWFTIYMWRSCKVKVSEVVRLLNLEVFSLANHAIITLMRWFLIFPRLKRTLTGTSIHAIPRVAWRDWRGCKLWYLTHILERCINGQVELHLTVLELDTRDLIPWIHCFTVTCFWIRSKRLYFRHVNTTFI